MSNLEAVKSLLPAPTELLNSVDARTEVESGGEAEKTPD
jgi:hypothetical protein